MINRRSFVSQAIVAAAVGVAHAGPEHPTERGRIIAALDRIGINFKEYQQSLWIVPDGTNVTGYDDRSLELRFSIGGSLIHIGLWNKSDVPEDVQGGA